MEAFTPVDINVLNEPKEIRILWADGRDSRIPIQRVRGYCPCAECQGHGTHTGKDKVAQILMPTRGAICHSFSVQRWSPYRFSSSIYESWIRKKRRVGASPKTH